MVSKYGFIYLSPGADPRVDRAVITTGGMAATIVAVPNVSAAPAVAETMVAEGIDLLELCGAFGPIITGEIILTTEGKVPVGSVTFGAESVSALAAAIAQ